MQLGAWRIAALDFASRPQIESFSESRESPKHWGFAWPSLVPLLVGGGGRIRTRHVINPAASVALDYGL